MGNLVSADVEGGYKRVCEELIANDVKNESGTLHWASPPLKQEQFTHFNECLSKNNCLKRLVLKDIDALPDSPSLAKVIQSHAALTCLAFSGRLPKEGFDIFVEAFLQSSTLTKLEIQNSIIPSNVVDGVISVLKQQDKANAKITSLVLKGCQMDANELNRLTKALQESASATTTLKTLEITLKPPIVAFESAKNLSSFFQANDSVLQEIEFAGFLENALPNLLEGAKGHPTLKRLAHEGKGLNDEDSMESIGQLLVDAPALSVLDLSNCSLDGACGVRLASSLQNTKASGLKELYLAHNSLSDEGVIALSQALEDTSSPTRETMEVLDLRMNQIGKEGIVALAKALQTNPPAFQKLHIGEESIRNNRTFEGEDVDALAEMIQKNTTLQSLHLEDASFQDEGIAKLLEALATNKTLKQWHVACYGTASFELIATSIPNLHLQKIHIRASGEIQLNQGNCRSLVEGLVKNESVREIKVSEFKGPNAAIWKRLEPKIADILSKRSEANGSSKRAMETNGGSQEDAKRAKTE